MPSVSNTAPRPPINNDEGGSFPPEIMAQVLPVGPMKGGCMANPELQ